MTIIKYDFYRQRQRPKKSQNVLYFRKAGALRISNTTLRVMCETGLKPGEFGERILGDI